MAWRWADQMRISLRYWRNEGSLGTWATTLKEGLEPLSRQRVFGCGEKRSRLWNDRPVRGAGELGGQPLLMPTWNPPPIRESSATHNGEMTGWERASELAQNSRAGGAYVRDEVNSVGNFHSTHPGECWHKHMWVAKSISEADPTLTHANVVLLTQQLENSFVVVFESWLDSPWFSPTINGEHSTFIFCWLTTLVHTKGAFFSSNAKRYAI